MGTHSENHRLLGGVPEASQRTRLELTRRDLTGITRRPVLGLRPPQEQFDEATMRAWLAVGGTYLFGANNSRVAAPELLAIGGDTLVLLGRVSPDDFIAAAPGASRDPAWLDGDLPARAVQGALARRALSVQLPFAALLATRVRADRGTGGAGGGRRLGGVGSDGRRGERVVAGAVCDPAPRCFALD